MHNATQLESAPIVTDVLVEYRAGLKENTVLHLVFVSIEMYYNQLKSAIKH